jgi:hypothetical protein
METVTISRAVLDLDDNVAGDEAERVLALARCSTSTTAPKAQPSGENESISILTDG